MTNTFVINYLAEVLANWDTNKSVLVWIGESTSATLYRFNAKDVLVSDFWRESTTSEKSNNGEAKKVLRLTNSVKLTKLAITKGERVWSVKGTTLFNWIEEFETEFNATIGTKKIEGKKNMTIGHVLEWAYATKKCNTEWLHSVESNFDGIDEIGKYEMKSILKTINGRKFGESSLTREYN